MLLLAVPNVSEGRAPEVVAAIGAAYEGGGARVLDTHADPDHHRTVHTLAAPPGALAGALVAGAREAVARIDLTAERGVHPHVGALDVAPVVFRDDESRGAACAEALVTAERLAEEVGLPVFLYGLLSERGHTRANLRRGGRAELATRIASGELTPDFGPPRLHATAGAVLVAARPPLVAFNIELAPPATPDDARRIAAAIREGGGEGLPGLRALGLELEQGGVVQVSTNVEDHRALPLADVVAAVARHAPVARCELVGLAPEAAFAGFPTNVQIRGHRTLEDALKKLES